MTATFIKAQSASAQVSTNKELNKEQKSFLISSWFESPNESNGNQIVYRKTEYTVIVGKDYFNFPPSKLNFTGPKNFTAEYLKLNQKSDPKPSQAGTWSLKGHTITLDMNGQKNTLTVLSIDADKLVLVTE